MKGIAFLTGFIGGLLTLGIMLPASSQVTSDNTTNTTINQNGNNFDIINGIQKGNNLFHSFKEFSIPKGASAIFNNSTDVVNIINRVTGGNISNIDGLIKASGNANLFLINPFGIVFGENASLNIGGSFFGSTAESILFADGFEFSAINPQNEPLLTVSVPLGLQYGNHSSSIELQNSHLSISSNKILALLGGDVFINGGSLTVSGGKIELGGLSNPGTVDINRNNSVNFPESISRGNVTLNNTAVVDVTSVDGGSIAVNATDFQMLGESKLKAGLILGTGTANLDNLEKDKDILINATGNINLKDKSLIENNLETNTIGNAGKIDLTTNSLSLTGGSRIQTKTNTDASSGDIHINSGDSVNIIGYADDDFVSGIFTIPSVKGTGDGGNIYINTNNLVLNESGRISIETKGQGNSGNLFVKTTGNIEIIGSNPEGTVSRFDAEVDKKATGNGGNVIIETNNLSLIDGGRISLETEGQGNAGNLDVKATGNIEIIGNNPKGTVSRFDAEVDRKATGNGGNVTIETTNLRIADGGRISVETESTGNAGNIEIKATKDVEVVGSSVEGFVSRIAATVDDSGMGQGGNILVQSSNLRLIDGGKISVETDGGGNGGRLEVQASESIEIIGRNTPQGRVSRLEAEVDELATGNGGDILVETDVLKLINGGKISVDTEGVGNGGVANIKATEIELVGISPDQRFPSRITAASQTDAAAGSVNITTDRLNIRNRAQITVSGSGSGDAGNLNINAGSIFLDNQANIHAEVKNGSRGNISLKVEDEIIASNNSQISADVTGSATGGSIDLAANKLEFNIGSFISTNTTGTGNAGSINIKGNSFSFDGKSTGVFSEAVDNSTGDAGNINFWADLIQITNNAKISTSSRGLGEAGNINITSNKFKVNRASITATSSQTGGGNLLFNLDYLILKNNGLISTSVLDSTGNGGNITINSPIIAGFENSDIIANAVKGNGGNINIITQGIFGLKFRDQLTGESDIGASSKFGVHGKVDINNVGIDPGSGLVELSTELADSSQKISTGCSSKANNSFVITGKGGIPHHPNQYLISNQIWYDMRDLSISSKHNNNTVENTQLSNKKEIIEATGFIRNQKGEIELVAFGNKSFNVKQTIDCRGINR